MDSWVLVSCYVATVVAANLFTTAFGPSASVVSAFLLIGATIVLRDRLHDVWRGHGLGMQMGGLIAAAGIISAVLNHNSVRIAMASCVAFVVSEATDALGYHVLRRHRWLVRSNASNAPAAFADSIIFPTMAFGSLMPWIVVGQFAAKVGGGFLWSMLLRRVR